MDVAAAWTLPPGARDRVSTYNLLSTAVLLALLITVSRTGLRSGARVVSVISTFTIAIVVSMSHKPASIRRGGRPGLLGGDSRVGSRSDAGRRDLLAKNLVQNINMAIYSPTLRLKMAKKAHITWSLGSKNSNLEA